MRTRLLRWAVVVAALLVCTVGIVTRVATRNAREYERCTSIMTSIRQAIDGYFLAHRRLPATLAAVLMEFQTTGGRVERTAVDPWGTAIDYVVVDKRKLVFELRSAGADRLFQTSDDIIDRR